MLLQVGFVAALEVGRTRSKSSSTRGSESSLRNGCIGVAVRVWYCGLGCGLWHFDKSRRKKVSVYRMGIHKSKASCLNDIFSTATMHISRVDVQRRRFDHRAVSALAQSRPAPRRDIQTVQPMAEVFRNKIRSRTILNDIFASQRSTKQQATSIPTMLSTPTRYLPLAVLYALHSPLVLSAWCSASLYGTPIIADCKHALSWIPSIGKVPSDPQSQQPRIFADPQHLPIPYGGVSNEYRPHAIVQLPKIWKHSEDTPGADVCGDVCLRCRCEASVSVSTAKAEDRRCS